MRTRTTGILRGVAVLLIGWCVTALVILAGGCVHRNDDGTARPPTTQEIHDELVADARDVVDVAMGTQRTAAKQSQLAEKLIERANQIKDGAQNGLNSNTVRQIVTDLLILTVDDDLRPIVRPAANIFFRKLEQRFHINLDLVPNDSFPFLRQLVIDLCDAVIDTATPYLQHTNWQTVPRPADPREALFRCY